LIYTSIYNYTRSNGSSASMLMILGSFSQFWISVRSSGKLWIYIYRRLNYVRWLAYSRVWMRIPRWDLCWCTRAILARCTSSRHQWPCLPVGVEPRFAGCH